MDLLEVESLLQNLILMNDRLLRWEISGFYQCFGKMMEAIHNVYLQILSDHEALDGITSGHGSVFFLSKLEKVMDAYESRDAVLLQNSLELGLIPDLQWYIAYKDKE